MVSQSDDVSIDTHLKLSEFSEHDPALFPLFHFIELSYLTWLLLLFSSTFKCWSISGFTQRLEHLFFLTDAHFLYNLVWSCEFIDIYDSQIYTPTYCLTPEPFSLPSHLGYVLGNENSPLSKEKYCCSSTFPSNLSSLFFFFF